MFYRFEKIANSVTYTPLILQNWFQKILNSVRLIDQKIFP